MTTLRWITKINHVTAQEVRDYADTAQVTMMQAKKILQDQKGPVLQQRLENEWGFYWEDVPHVTEYRNKNARD